VTVFQSNKNGVIGDLNGVIGDLNGGIFISLVFYLFENGKGHEIRKNL
jgi:hypothetical protein